MEFLMNKCRSTFETEWQKVLDFIEGYEGLPNKRRALIYTEKLRERLSHQIPEFLADEFLFHIVILFSYSSFLGEFLIKHIKLLEKLKTIYKKSFFPSDFFVPTIEGETEKQFMNRIRIYKNFQMARVVLRDILKLADFEELVRDVTLIHDSIIKATLKFAESVMEKRYGKPSSGYIVIDMGKAGGFELNYSSDIDLLYVYESRYGETTGGNYGKLQNHDYFVLLSNYITDLLSKKTEEGICMVIDLRLRPNGTLGPICNDIEALEQYYTAVARPWERFALLKARPSAGDVKRTGIEFLKLAKTFIFRKYVDLTLIEEVLRLKELIKSKVNKKGKKIDLKLGEGGIREIEFIVQAFQLIYGGKYPQIRSQNTLIALKRLLKWGFITEKEYSDLRSSYLFLRQAEHMLQITNFRQTQTFHPEGEEAEELARKMGFKDRESFLKKLNQIMKTVNAYFNKFFPTGDRKPLSVVTAEDLEKMGFREPLEVKRFIEVLLNLKTLSPEEVNTLDVMGDRFLELLFEVPSSKNTMKNLVSFFEKEEGRVFFFSILSEIHALKLLFYLLSTKEFFIKRFRETPEIVDLMFNPTYIEEPITVERLKKDFEEFKNLRFVKNLSEIRALLRLRLGRVKIEEFLKEITAIVDFLLDIIYTEVRPDFSLASVGKHGSREMNIGSDIDLLFFSSLPSKDNQKALEIIKRLESLGYEVDTRLRPFGEKGELVFTINYFKKYTETTARVWERLAFTRFRFLYGNLKGETEKIVEKFLFEKPLDFETLNEIFEMRKVLERELGKGQKDIKYSCGGVVDLEFISYIYQLFIKKRIGNTFEVLSLLGDTEKKFKKAIKLYRQIRWAETEKRIFGEYIFYSDRIELLKKEIRKMYQEFSQWIKTRVSANT
ncbi:(Glutamate--ammonia-ligase) adenylyltransferase [Desulfurobacterium thermolithotrophum DSM 11699]|uniref:(Glutamate--ammonia-ligase) adenylyltransferase n=1 Tax=Desulfurobacterium thermolithotrophum (strain DSM 11699 / BSA) TaxID=868864 RepID=F0S344_DESTD|nr:[glutamate--ammonia-ligase] adenylyltransferase [Desulfurobacterium thermolithotrophum]ADY73266.1 (Glutamate--ammonia-ligase) adenylyltransferase [Desulfurobacterium thermolithotrophum DSM 11699]